MYRKKNIKQHEIVFFRNGEGHLLYGRVTSCNGKRITIKALGFKGQNGIYRFQKSDDIFPGHSSLENLSIQEMAELNRTAKDSHAVQKKAIGKKCNRFLAHGTPFGSQDMNNVDYADLLAKRTHGFA
jgi:hypothetical protein